MLRKLLLLSAGIFVLFNLHAQSGCPGCLVELPAGLPEDTIYLSDAADGQVGVYYDSDLGFRMPKTTTPVNANDPDTPPGLAISQITITSVSNLPPGLGWEANQAVFNVSEETDGCVKLCGIPLIPGFYNVEVVVTAQVLFVSQVSSFSFPILILPGASVTEGFTLENNSGCGSVTAHLTNNVPSGGAEGYSYLWDFGNGNMSVNENPSPQTYDEAGVYEISYQAIIDTFGFLLTEVVVESVTCNDLFNNAPDLRIEIWDPDGERIYESLHIEDAQPPLTFTLNIPIGEGNYVLRVMDEDSGLQGGDDECGTINFNRFSSGSFNGAGLAASLAVLHPVDTIRSSDTVWVYEQPAPPLLASEEPASLCEGDAIKLSVANGYDTGLQWYHDSLPLIDVEGPALTVDAGGDYWVSYTTADGCRATSEVVSLSFHPLPVAPVFQNFNNLLSLYDPGSLPASHSLQWYRNGLIIEGATGQEYCINSNGAYRLEVTDLITGCRASYELQSTYNPDFPGCLTSGAEDQNRISFTAYPNPTDGMLRLEGQLPAGEVSLLLINSQGQAVGRQQCAAPGGLLQETLNLSALPAGLYIVEARAGEQAAYIRVAKR